MNFIAKYLPQTALTDWYYQKHILKSKVENVFPSSGAFVVRCMFEHQQIC